MESLFVALWGLGEVFLYEELEDGLDFICERMVGVSDPGYGGRRVEGDV